MNGAMAGSGKAVSLLPQLVSQLQLASGFSRFAWSPKGTCSLKAAWIVALFILTAESPGIHDACESR